MYLEYPNIIVLKSSNQLISAALMKKQSSVYPIEEEVDKESDHEVNIDYKSKFKEVTDQFGEMIYFLDFSFEQAFDRKDKDFMLAYKVLMIQVKNIGLSISNSKRH